MLTDTLAEEDYYAILEIEPSVSPAAISIAYWRLASHYGTLLKQDPEAARRLDELNRAYEVLINPDRREQYNRARGCTAAPPPEKAKPKRQRRPKIRAEPEVLAEGLDTRVIGRRVVAGIIDAALLAVGLAVVIGVWGDNNLRWGSGTLTFSTSLGWQPFALFCLAALLYSVVLEGAFAATIGKGIMQLRVVHYNGRPCGWRASLKRNLLRPADALPFGLPYLVGLVAIQFFSNNQRLGDKWAKIVVVRASSLPVAPQATVTKDAPTGNVTVPRAEPGS